MSFCDNATDYQQVIDILMDPSMSYEDFKNLVIKIAKSHPAVVIEAAKEPKPWMRDVDSFLHFNQKISAIRLYRNETGVGLREAKEIVEDRQRELGIIV